VTLLGDDTSKYQGTILGRDFEIIKATGGDDGLYVDPTCDTKYQANKAAGKLLCVYHITRQAYDAVTEANFFVDNVLGYVGEAVLVLDFETETNVAWAKAFFDQVYARTRVWGLLYASASAINAVNWSPVAVHDALYEAGYPNQFNVLNPPTPRADGADMPYASGAWSYATIWQYSSSAGTLDKDIAYITPDGWHRLAMGDRNAPTPPTTTTTTTQAPQPAPQPTTTTTTTAAPTTTTTTTASPQNSTTTTTTGTQTVTTTTQAVATQPTWFEIIESILIAFIERLQGKVK
jgi:hypothetical protein